MPSYAAGLKPLFRDRDRGSMLTHFGLWSYYDIIEREDAIVARLGGGTMPCGGLGTSTHVELFGTWISEGTSRRTPGR